jgi:uncharacterized YccA/Bax inhibitor family protein
MFLPFYIPSTFVLLAALIIVWGLVIANGGTFLLALAIPQRWWWLRVARALRYATIVLLTWSTLSLLLVLIRDAASPLLVGVVVLGAIGILTLLLVANRDRAAKFGPPDAGRVIAAAGFGIAVAGAVAFWLDRLR